MRRTQRKVEPYAPGESPIDEFNKVFKSGVGAALDSKLFKGAAGAYDAVAAATTQYAAKPAVPGFLANLAPGYTDFSLLSLLTPEIGPQDRESLAFSGGLEERQKMENIGTSRRPEYIPVLDKDGNPIMENRPASGLMPSLTRAANVPGFLGNVFFGDARTAGEKMNAGIPFEDLSPEEKLGVRFFLLDLVPLPGFAKAGQQAGKQAIKAGMDAVPTASQVDKIGSVGAMSTRDAIIERIKNEYGEVTQAELELIAEGFKDFPPAQRDTIAGLLTKDQQSQLLEIVKNTLEAKPKGAYGGYGVIEKDGVVGVQYKKGQRVDKFVPLTDLQLTMRGPSSKRPGEFEFNILEDKRAKPDIESTKKALKAANIAGKEAQLAARAEEAKTIMKVFLENKNLPLRSKIGDSLFTKVNEAIDPATRTYRPNKKASARYISEVLDEYGLRPIQKKAPDAETKRDLITGVTKLTGTDPIVDPLVRSFNPKEFPTIARVEEFFKSQNINMKNIKTPLDEPRLFNAIESNRVALQDSLKENEFIQQLLKERGETRSLTFNKSHLDRSIKPVTDADQFRGLDPTDVKILGETVNNFLQNDLEIVLLQKIQKKDVAGTKRIIKDMKNFGIGTRLNDPNRPGLTKEDYQWLDKNKLITVPTIKPGSPGAPFKNYDAVIFGTKDQPNVKELIEAELAARDYYKNKVNFEADFPGESYLQFFSEGGYVGDMIPVKASTGFFAKLFGKTPEFRKEGMDVTDLTGPTKAQTQTLESLYPNTAFPDYVPGEVFFSNFDLALSKRDAPLVFNTNKEFRDYMNQSGVGLDELDDAKVLSFANSKFKEGQPVLAQDLLSIAAQSPVRNIFVDGYGFRSDKINAAPKNVLDYTGNIVTKQGDPVFKEVSYSGTGLLPGAQDNTYRERVMRLSKEDLRGDPGSVPGGGAAHNFGDNRDNSGNYVMAWTRQTDRQGNIVPGQSVDRQTGEIVTPSQIADQTKLQDIEAKINKLFEDPISGLQLGDDGLFLPEQSGAVASQVQRLVENSNGRLTNAKAYEILLGQAKSKQKQIKNLQSQYNEEAARLKNFKPESTKEISTTVIDELQSDVFQNAKRKATELAVRLQVMAEDGIPLSQMRDEELLKYFQNPAELGLENIRPGSVFRPVGKTKEELMAQYNELMSMQQELTALAQQPAYAITPANVNLYRDTIKGGQTEILDEMSENISSDLINSLYPDLPMKDRLQYADALSKQAIAEAAYRLFVEKDPNAPKYISFMSGEVVAGDAYNQTGRASTSVADRQADKLARIEDFKKQIREGSTSAQIRKSELPGVGTDEFYGGPLSKSVEGGHYTSTMESIFKKIAQQYGSKLEIINVAASKPTKTESYDIINQNTGQVVGSGDTYRQAENIANDLVDSEGGRYTIDRNPKIQYDTRPIFGMELTPQMLQLFKAYK